MRLLASVEALVTHADGLFAQVLDLDHVPDTITRFALPSTMVAAARQKVRGFIEEFLYEIPVTPEALDAAIVNNHRDLAEWLWERTGAWHSRKVWRELARKDMYTDALWLREDNRKNIALTDIDVEGMAEEFARNGSAISLQNIFTHWIQPGEIRDKIMRVAARAALVAEQTSTTLPVISSMLRGDETIREERNAVFAERAAKGVLLSNHYSVSNTAIGNAFIVALNNGHFHICHSLEFLVRFSWDDRQRQVDALKTIIDAGLESLIRAVSENLELNAEETTMIAKKSVDHMQGKFAIVKALARQFGTRFMNAVFTEIVNQDNSDCLNAFFSAFKYKNGIDRLAEYMTPTILRTRHLSDNTVHALLHHIKSKKALQQCFASIMAGSKFDVLPKLIKRMTGIVTFDMLVGVAGSMIPIEIFVQLSTQWSNGREHLSAPYIARALWSAGFSPEQLQAIASVSKDLPPVIIDVLNDVTQEYVPQSVYYRLEQIGSADFDSIQTCCTSTRTTFERAMWQKGEKKINDLQKELTKKNEQLEMERMQGRRLGSRLRGAKGSINATRGVLGESEALINELQKELVRRTEQLQRERIENNSLTISLKEKRELVKKLDNRIRQLENEAVKRKNEVVKLNDRISSMRTNDLVRRRKAHWAKTMKESFKAVAASLTPVKSPASATTTQSEAQAQKEDPVCEKRRSFIGWSKSPRVVLGKRPLRVRAYESETSVETTEPAEKRQKQTQLDELWGDIPSGGVL